MLITDKLADLKELLAENKKVRNGILGAVALIIIWYAISSMSGDSGSYEDRLEARRSARQTSVLGVSKDVSDFENLESQSLTERLTAEFGARERELQQRETRQRQELDQVNARLAEIDSNMQRALESVNQKTEQLQRLVTQQTETMAVNATSPQNARAGATQAQLAGDEKRYDIDGNNRVLRRNQTHIVTQAPRRIDGGVIRTITQRDVREVRESGVIDVREVQNNALSNHTQSVRVEGGRDEPLTTEHAGARKREEPHEFTLAMGSIISGTLINGVAAPTSLGRQKDPIPVLMRVKRDAVMPNHHSLDIRDCFLLGSTQADLASSRVFIRAEAISCITESGEAIERNITAYAVSSDDGMAGIKGTIIERSNVMLANTMKAGFLSGFAQAATPQRIQGLNTNPTSSAVWESQQLDRYATSGVLKGASSAMDRIADYYMAMAESTWPVVELLPGIEVDFIVQRGMGLKLNGSDYSNTIGVRGQN